MADNKYADSTIKKYMDDLAAKMPAPGGGSASAVSSALGLALLGMVANYTVGKKGYEQHSQKIAFILEGIEKSRKRMTELIDLDVEAYGRVSAVFKIKDGSEQERKEKVQQALKAAMSVPWEIMEISVNSIKYAEELAKICNKNLISDVGCAVFMLDAAVESAKLNVMINLKGITDTEFVKEKNSRMKSAIEAFKGTSRLALADTNKLMSE